MDEIEDGMPSADHVEGLRRVVEELTRACDMVEVSAQFDEGKRVHLRAMLALARDEAEKLLDITRSSEMH